MMTQDERILLLIASLEQHGKVTTDEICERFSISKDSARRDLLRVVQTPGIQRIRGGAIKAPVEIQALSYHQKNTDNPSKIAIAGLAAELATTNDFLMLDTGTSISHLALQLKGPLTVIR